MMLPKTSCSLAEKPGKTHCAQKAQMTHGQMDGWMDAARTKRTHTCLTHSTPTNTTNDSCLDTD